jgi:hypothetical protein
MRSSVTMWVTARRLSRDELQHQRDVGHQHVWHGSCAARWSSCGGGGGRGGGAVAAEVVVAQAWKEAVADVEAVEDAEAVEDVADVVAVKRISQQT